MDSWVRKKLIERQAKMESGKSDEDLKGVLATRKFSFRGPLVPEMRLERFKNVDQAIAEFGYLEIKLNSIRYVLNDIDIRKWAVITDSSDISSKFKTTILKFYHDCMDDYNQKQFGMKRSEATLNLVQEYCAEPEVLTRAWIKFHEILFKFDIQNRLVSTFKIEAVVNSSNPCRALFLCEAPGGFISCYNNHISGADFKWIATSLNPYYEGCGKNNSAILDDRFIVDTFGNWFFGRENVGNIGESNFVFDLREFVRMKWSREHFLSFNEDPKFHLITADGGLDCSDQPNLQEQLSFNLILREINVALEMLAIGGILIIKFFNSFKRETVYLKYLLYQIFEQVSVFKPLSSKGGNSEVYLICMGFGKKDEYEKAIHLFHIKLSQYRSLNSSEFSIEWSNIPDDFIYQAYECCYFYTKKQVAVIRQNVYLYQCAIYDVKLKSKSRIKAKVAKRFIGHYPVQVVGKSRSLANKYIAENENSLPFYDNEEVGDFSAQIRQQIRLRPIREITERTGSLNMRLNSSNGHLDLSVMQFVLQSTVINPGSVQSLYRRFFVFDRHDLDCSTFGKRNLQLTFGKTYVRIQNSKFCDNSVLQLYHLYRQTLQSNEFNLSVFHESILKSSFETLQTFQYFESALQKHLAECSFIDNSSSVSKHARICDLSQFTPSKPAYQTFCQTLVQIFSKQNITPEISPHLPTTQEEETQVFYVLETNSNLAEPLMFEYLLDKINQMIPILSPADVLFIRFDTLLGRASVSLIYLLTMFLYNEYSIVPLCLQHGHEQLSGGRSESLLSNTFILHCSEERQQSPNRFRQNLVYLQRILTQIQGQKSAFQQSSSHILLELYPLPIILKDQMFCQVLRNCNIVYLVEALKISLQSKQGF